MFYDFIYLAKGFRMRRKVRSTLTTIIIIIKIPILCNVVFSAINNMKFKIWKVTFLKSILIPLRNYGMDFQFAEITET